MQRYLKTFQGVGGLVFGNDGQRSQEDDGGVEKLLERITNGVHVEDRHRAMEELQDMVAESRSAQLALGATGLPVILSVLKGERGDLDLVRGALETLVNALGSEGRFYGVKGQVQPGLLNSELLARENGSASLLLNLLDEDDFYVRYHSLCLLTMLSRSSSIRLQEAVLATPQGLTRLMDMLQDREVIRNEALLLLTLLTRSAKEIQKIAVFEGVFEKLFSIIVEEGGSDGGIVVQDCLDLLNNILRDSPTNQSFLRETLGLQPVASLLKLRESNTLVFSQQKTANVLCILETVSLLLERDTAKDLSKDANVTTNQTVLMQNNVLDQLLNLSVKGRVAAVAIRCASLRCVGDLIHGHSRNAENLWERTVSEASKGNAGLSTILDLMLKASNRNEWVAAEYIIQCYCEGNPEGQFLLASAVGPLVESQSIVSRLQGTKGSFSFGSMLFNALDMSTGQRDFELSCRAARVLVHILEDNLNCKEQVLQEFSTSQVPSENMLSRCVRCLAAATVQAPQDSNSIWKGKLCLQAMILRLLVVWLANCPKAVASFLEPSVHMSVIIGLLTSDESPVSVHVKGLAAVLLGECILHNTCEDGRQSATMVVDVICQRVGLASYFEKWEELQKDATFASTAMNLEPLEKSTYFFSKRDESTDSVSVESDDVSSESELQSMLNDLYNVKLVKQIQILHPIVKEKTIQLFSQPKSKRADLAVIGRKKGEADYDYIGRLEMFLRRQAMEMQDLLSSNVALAEELVARSSTRTLKKSTQEPNMAVPSFSDLEAAREKGGQEAANESEAELNDLLVCLGQAESKVERLRARLVEMGEDVDGLLRGVGEDAAAEEFEESTE